MDTWATMRSFLDTWWIRCYQLLLSCTEEDTTSTYHTRTRKLDLDRRQLYPTCRHDNEILWFQNQEVFLIKKFLLQIPMQKFNFNIYLKNFKIHKICISKKDPDSFKICNRGKSFIIIHDLHLSKTLSIIAFFIIMSCLYILLWNTQHVPTNFFLAGKERESICCAF